MKVVLAVVICAFAVAALYSSAAIVEQQRVLRDTSRYNLAWAAGQAVAELYRFEQRVAASRLAGGGIDHNEVRLRFDILQNRLHLFKDGKLKEFVDRTPEHRDTVAEFATVMAELDPMIDGIEQSGMAELVLARVTPLDSGFARLAAAANAFSGEQVAEDQRQLLALHWLFSALIAGLLLGGLALLSLLVVQNRLLKRAHRDLRIMANDLLAAKEKAEAGNETKSRFLANMSHELRTPLNAIIGFSEMMAREMFGPLGHAKYRGYAGDILKSGRHMHDLITDILTMARLEAGVFELAPEPLDLGSVVRGALGILRGTEIAKGREIVVDPAGEWPSLRADRRAVRQMLINLAANAVKFSEPHTPVRITSRRRPNGELALTVSDRGVGMASDDIEVAVRPFHQLDSGLARRHEGTGLGLSIVKGLIEGHGGRLEIDSRPGFGSAISLVFPNALMDAPPTAQEVSEELP
jgi:signal transduction histidine kinase